ncbi:MAG TPA: hypothetical protein VLE22_13830 [Bryobacteraceae bacterium]|nr:hypothetical protein [Bryobacteraceae bacterium]
MKLAVCVALVLIPAAVFGAGDLNYDGMAARIAVALKLRPGERVLLRYDPGYFAEILPPLRKQIRAAKAEFLRPLLAKDPVPVGKLSAADVFIRLPLGSSARALTAAEETALVKWVDGGGRRRELHFHWSDGSRLRDGLPGEHPAEYDALYQDALDIDYEALRAVQDRAIRTLRLGTVRVSTPAGTDLMFRIAKRPFNKQDGDASGERAQAARVRVDRHIELPAGVIRVAPVEATVCGQFVIPEARFGDKIARKVVIQIDNGRVRSIKAAEGQEALNAELAKGGEAAMRFREFALGLNPKLIASPDKAVVPYYGYGAGVVRFSLGDNEELGGDVRGSFVRWFFLTDATVHVDYRYLVKGGKLVMEGL